MQLPDHAPIATPPSVSSKFEPQTLSPGASAHLDIIRASAAWAVLWGHLRAIFFLEFQQLSRRSLFLKAFYFFTGFGHQAVMVFFVLSGFLISSTVIRRYLYGNWSWLDYAVDRSSRLYVVLIPGLLFGLLWDKAGSSLFASSGLYSHPLNGFGAAVVENQITFGNFVGNLFFLQTIVCPTFGSNGPLWSLANEFWYYVLFPVLMFAGLAWTKHLLRRAIPLTIFACCLAVFLGWEKLIGFLIWLAGCVLVIAYSRLRLRAKRWLIPYALISSLALAVCLVTARTRETAAIGSDLAVGIAFTLFLFAVLQIDSGVRHPSYPRIAHILAGFSYSLYALHFPLLLFLRAWIAPSQRWQPDTEHLLYGAIIGAAVLSFAWVISIFTENQTRAIRNLIRTMILLCQGSR
jgi:peptidoglycan/LPS O-acetylase OafA/YrhL